MPLNEEVLDRYRIERAVFADRPWVSSIMVVSIDSAVDIGGTSGPLGNDTDRALLGLMRREHGAVIVGASTARHENYRPSKHPGVRIFVASRNPKEDWDSELWQDDRTTLVTTESAPRPPAHVDVVAAGEADLDLLGALREMKRRGVDHVSCEGGPRINSAFLFADLFDEVSLTISPQAVGGTIQRPIGDKQFEPRRYALASHGVDDDWVFLRYLRRRLSEGSPPKARRLASSVHRPQP